MILVDSSVWIDYFNGCTTRETTLLDSLLEHERIAVGDLILVEVLQGFKSDRAFKQARELLDLFEQVTLTGKAIAVQSAMYYRELRSKGVTVRKTIDVIIGTFCIVNRISLLHSDRDFEPMVSYLGLKCI